MLGLYKFPFHLPTNFAYAVQLSDTVYLFSDNGYTGIGQFKPVYEDMLAVEKVLV